MQSSAVSPWLLKLGIRRELGLYADTVAKRGAHYFFYAWELPVGVQQTHEALQQHDPAAT
jgi:hypothetical protein